VSERAAAGSGSGAREKPTGNELERIVDQMDRAFRGPAWHGPSLREALAGVDARAAAARPIPGAHTIWELVLHVAAWEGVVRRRLEGDRAGLPDAENFPDVSDPGETAWQAALARLESGHRALMDGVSRIEVSDLDRPLDAHGTSAYGLLHGAAQHDIYHAAQIVLLRRAAGP
jgi:uncharacterized damage-inducible protein DinB